MQTILRLAFLLLALAAVQPAAEAAVMMPGPTPVAPETPEWNAVGRINRPGGIYCTGVLIAPDRVLTAAHCLWDYRDSSWLKPNEIHFVAGFRRGAYVGHAVAKSIRLPEGIQVDKNGWATDAADDWAMLTLERPIAGPNLHPLPLAGPLARAGLGTDTAIARIGYERNRPYLPELVASCRPLFVTGGHDLLLIHDCAVTTTDAGSPILMRDRGQWVVLGVHVRTAKWKGRNVGIAALLERAVPTAVLKKPGS